jgi:D-glycero-beta-D-manno-heptose 1-phosphate adenylyltransferase
MGMPFVVSAVGTPPQGGFFPSQFFISKGLSNRQESLVYMKWGSKARSAFQFKTESPRGNKVLQDYRQKIKDLASMKKEIDHLKEQGGKIVFTNGCFDLLHPGHTRYLWAARQLGDYLVVAVNSDRSVREIKGEGRPVTAQEDRTEVLAALDFVDGVVVFDEDNPLEVIRCLLPDVLVKGGDWPEDKIIGAEVVKEAGGEVKRIPFVSGYSTTTIITKIREG